jgi:hypothetical protein
MLCQGCMFDFDAVSLTEDQLFCLSVCALLATWIAGGGQALRPSSEPFPADGGAVSNSYFLSGKVSYNSLRMT